MKKGFTLIELLIVVAIIAILAAIAVPNFLEAQTRAKISRAKADMRTSSTALEAYCVDNNGYPNPHSFGIATAKTNPADALVDSGNPTSNHILERLSTPIAYVTTAFTKDPFKLRGRYSSATAQGIASIVNATAVPADDDAAKLNSSIYQAWNSDQRYTIPPDGFSSANLPKKTTAWLLHSAGPDGNYYNLGGVLSNDGVDQLPYTVQMIYDATNGTVSRGSIWRTGGASGGSGTYKAGAGMQAAINRQN